MKRTMNMVLVTLLFFSVHSSVLYGQEELPNPWQLGNQKLQQGHNYLSVLLELRELKQQYMTSQWKESFCQFIGTVNSYVGNYSEAMVYFDKQGRYPSNALGYQNFYGYKPVNALQVIQSVADSSQVIFINEAHHVPLHRAFSIQLLKILYNKGFRYFAAETLNEMDKELNDRKYPLLHFTGGYTDEPVYGHLVRTALRLGFKVVAYEHTVPCDPRKDDNCQNQRERGQAQNLYDRILAKEPSAKIFVHAGYGHIDEKGSDNWIPMAKYFKEITGINPFTIDQQTMTEHSSPEYEEAEYRYVVEKGLIKEPAIFKSDDGKLWIQEFSRGSYDVQVFHPRTQYQHGRPEWLSFSGDRKAYHLGEDVCGGTTPCLVQAYFSSEDSRAVPIDRIEISETTDIPALMLPEGKFRIQSVDKGGNALKEFSAELNYGQEVSGEH